MLFSGPIYPFNVKNSHLIVIDVLFAWLIKLQTQLNVNNFLRFHSEQNENLIFCYTLYYRPTGLLLGQASIYSSILLQAVPAFTFTIKTLFQFRNHELFRFRISKCNSLQFYSCTLYNVCVSTCSPFTNLPHNKPYFTFRIMNPTVFRFRLR